MARLGALTFKGTAGLAAGVASFFAWATAGDAANVKAANAAAADKPARVTQMTFMFSSFRKDPPLRTTFVLQCADHVRAEYFRPVASGKV